MESFQEKLKRVIAEEVEIVPYDSKWPGLFEKEKQHLINCLPKELIKRVEHFGSTAVPGLCAKPIIDILVEVATLEDTKKRIVPVLESQGYDYFWRPSFGDDTPPYYAWFIKRDSEGKRTHHIHMVESSFEHWDRLLFRDYLIEHPSAAGQYQKLKMELSEKYANDRIAYTKAKTDFIAKITKKAKRYYER
ncbi:MAG: GrpB family protein [Candidatus Omnitrophota bacterium]